MKLYKSVLVMLLATAMSQPLWADQALKDKALEHFNKKDYVTANRLMDQHIANNPEDADAYLSKAFILIKMGELRKALTALENAISHSPKNHIAYQQYGAALQRLAYYLINNEKMELAVEAADHALTIIPTDPEKYKRNKELKGGLAQIYFGRGLVYYERWCQTGNPSDQEAALEAWKLSIEMEPVSATQELLLGVYTINGLNYGSALTHFKAASTLRSSNRYAKLWTAIAEASLEETQLSSVISDLESLDKLFVSNPGYHLALGNIYRANGQYGDAKNSYLAARSIIPGSKVINSALNELFLISNDISSAIEILNTDIGNAPSDFNCRYRLAAFLHQTGQYDNAFKAYTEAMSVANANQKAEAQMEQAIIALEQADIASPLSEAKLEELFPSRSRSLVANSGNPRYKIFEAYAAPTAEAREAAVREALKEVGPDSNWLHKEAFTAWAIIETAREQPLRALEMTYQAWRRTAGSSPTCAKLQKLFDSNKAQALKSYNKELRSVSKSKNAKQQERARALEQIINEVSHLSLGTQGDLFGQLPGARQATSKTLVTASVDANLPHLITTASSPITWDYIIPPWSKSEDDL